MELKNYCTTVLRCTFRCCYLRGGQRPPEGPEGPPSPPHELEGGARSAPTSSIIYVSELQSFSPENQTRFSELRQEFKILSLITRQEIDHSQQFSNYIQMNEVARDGPLKYQLEGQLKTRLFNEDSRPIKAGTKNN